MRRSARNAAAVGLAALVALPAMAHAASTASAATPARPAATPSPGATGRLLVTLKPPAPGAAHASAARATRAVAARAGATTRLTIPRLRTAAVEPRAGETPAELARRLRADPRVLNVTAERRFALRYVPSDPAFTSAERGEAGTVGEWWAPREGLPAAWDIARGDGARVAVIDTGVDGTHPDLAGKVVASADFDDTIGDGPPTVDENGHGTHVASLACAEPDNGIGLAGAGLGCGLLIAKSDLTEGSVARALVWAADNGAEAINMSFGTDGRFAASDVIVQALRYANNKGAVLVAAAADTATARTPVLEQGDPANVLQPTNTGSDINQNFGLSVTAVNAQDARAVFAGRGTQISMAAYGTYGPGGNDGLLGAFPTQTTQLERGDRSRKLAPCRCRTSLGGDNRYAYLPGTSMSAPQVAGVAALMRHLNPDLPPADVVKILKQTARRPSDVAWTPDVGWGILDAGAALAAARSIDAHPPRSQLQRPKVTGRSILLRWKGSDDAVAGVVASGIDKFEVWRQVPGHAARKIKTTRAHSYRLRGVRGRLYRFYTIAIDHAGNREAPPAKPDASVRVARR
ncbi:MAG TPA: S8 family serine peptidase [Baekduia sp.]|uniref:S8 family peptidase n=1 Tax=Baekduia sp. TaxID=2600305 RepID=UPI002D787F13|nr:S8 family serine peptidase [Baekduia sp.]HET6507645.1 S8 family serine peptidase [Baekduia sp.]